MVSNIVGTRGLKSLCPTIFDLGVISIMFITFIQSNFYRSVYFVFSSIFIFILSLFLDKKRKYVSIPLYLLLVWAFFMMFVHTKAKFVENPLFNYYFNVSIMFEGFIFIFAGVLLLKSIIENISDVGAKIVLFSMPIFLVPLLKIDFMLGRMTIVLSLILGIAIYFMVKRVWFVFMLLVWGGISIVLLNWQWVVMKWQCRPYIWVELIRQIKENPLFGTGFSHDLGRDNMIFVREIWGHTYGYVFRHNDFLSLTAYLGLIVLPLLLWYVVSTLKIVWKTIYLIPILSICILCFFQMTMFVADKAVICILLWGISIKEALCLRG